MPEPSLSMGDFVINFRRKCYIFLWQISLSDLVFQHMLYSLGMVPATLVGDKHLPAELDLIWPVLTPL
ncbi:MAG: hypothetical protein SVR94_04545 [Pseudomonadota bacterium]|nr:hypothetical protein [Pseudomonadota bacterium]